MSEAMHAVDEAGKSDGRAPALPAELLSRIIACLVPGTDRNASTVPHPSGSDLDYSPELPSSPSGDLLSAAASCTLLHHIAGRALLRAPLLRSLKCLNLLASTIASDAKKQTSSSVDDTYYRNSHSRWIRAMHLPPGDGLLQPGDTLADQTCYVDSLRILFDHAERLDFISLEHRQAGAALLEFLHPSTACRPHRVTLSNLSFSAPPFSTTKSLAPLSKLTHLHLINIVPPPALISFLVGEPINAEEQGNVLRSIEAGLSPRGTLECLRLSLLPPDALVEFGAYIAWRKAWMCFEQLSTRQKVREPPPRAPLWPARRFAVQEALYDLAIHSSRLPRLRLLLLELSPLGPLCSPVEEELANGPFAHFLRSRGVSPPLSSDMPSDAGTRDSGIGRTKQPADVRAKRSDANEFHDVLQTSRAAADRVTMAATMVSGPPTLHLFSGSDGHGGDHGGDFVMDGGSDDDEEEVFAATGEEMRIGVRDQYWRRVEAGKLALIELWTKCQQENAGVGSESPNIRVVAARRMGHDRREGFQDFYCQAQHEPHAVHATVSSSVSGTDESMAVSGKGAEDVGCWADPDVFSLVSTAPYLSFKTMGGYDHGWYWTGELPRETNHPSTFVIPSQIAC